MRITQLALIGSIASGLNLLPIVLPMDVGFRSMVSSVWAQTPESQTITGRLTTDSPVLDDGSYYVLHRFNGQAGKVMVLELLSDEFDAYLLMVGPGGNEVAQDDDRAGGNNARIVVQLPVNGTYSVVVNSYAAGETGSYRLNIREVTEQELATDGAKNEAEQLFQQGIQQFQTSQFQEALQSWEQALAIYREIGDRSGEGETLGNLGLAYSDLGQYRKAINYHQQYLAIAREIGDRNGEGAALGNLGSAYSTLGEYQQAIDYYTQSLAIVREIGDQQGEGTILGNLGVTHFSLGQYPQAIDYYEQRLSIAREIGDQQGEGNALGNLGNVYLALGQYQQAIEYQERQLSIAREIDNQKGEGAALGNLGNAYLLLGEYQQAIAYQEQRLSIAREIGDRQGEGNALGNLGNAYYSLGQYQRAINYHEQHLAIAREIGDRQGEGNALSNLSSAYRFLSQYQQAIKYAEQHLVIAREIGDRRGEGNALGNLGIAYDSLGQYQQAIGYYEQRLNIAREIGDRRGEGTALGNLGTANFYLGRYQQAIEYSEQSLIIVREIRDRESEGALLNNIGDTFRAMNQLVEAEAVLFKALDIWQSLRNPQLNDADRISLFETQSRTYKLLQRVLIAQNNPEKNLKALEVAEQGRARSLVELLSSRLSATNLTISSAPPDLAAIRWISQQQNVTLVQYSVINFGNVDPALYIWVIKPSGEIRFQSVNLAQRDQPLSDLVALSRTAIGARGRNSGRIVVQLTEAARQQQVSEQRRALQQLHQLLIQPIAADLPTDPEEKIVFIPQAELFLVPFAALIDDNGQYLIEQHTISTAPSIQVFDFAAQAAQGRSLSRILPEQVLIVGNPTMPSVWDADRTRVIQLSSLPGTEQEAVTIAQQFGTQPLLASQATEAVVSQRMQTARLIHLATHGLLEYGDPTESGVLDVPGAIALAASQNDDGLLTARELYQMQLQADLVVLSACDTGRGNITGDGVLGLSRSIIQAGVPSVIVSLWKVPDDSTADLMTRFYQHLQNTPDTAQALRKAMLETLQTYPEPIHWAAFTLLGASE